MSENYEQKSPEQIQRDIEQTRAEMGDTLDTIRQKLSPGQLFDEALDYLKRGGANQFFTNLGDTVKQNPIPVSLIGIGVAWLMMGGSRDPYTSRTWTADDRTPSKLGEAASSTTAKAGQMVQGVRERAGAASGRLGEMAHSAQERAGAASERLGEMAHGARHQIGEAANRIRYQTVRARDTYNYLRTEQPLILGVLGFALGAALGAGVPSTRQEDELMGEMRDDYVHRAKEAGAEYLEQGKQAAMAAGEAVKKAGAEYLEQGIQAATAAVEAAKEQTEKEGLKSAGAEQRRRATEEKPEHVSPASHHTARGETTRQGSRS